MTPAPPAPVPDVRVSSPFPEYALPRVWHWIQEFRDRVADDFGPQSLDQFMLQWAASECQSWGVWRGAELGGLVTFRPWSPLTGELHCLYKRQFWGAATTEAALRLVCREVFSDGVNKISSMVFADNANIIGLAKRLGARKEGHLRQQTLRRGQKVDMVVLGLLAEEFRKGDRYATTGDSSGADRGLVRAGSAGEPEKRTDQ